MITGNRIGQINCIVIAFLVWSTSAFSHHSVDGRYDRQKTVTLNGVITKVDWINPHIRMYFDVTDDDGSVTTWEISGAPPTFLRRAGISKSLIVADQSPEAPVELIGILARDEQLKHIWVYHIKYQDGHFIQFSSSD